jgi:putative DNA primase/helicase
MTPAIATPAAGELPEIGLDFISPHPDVAGTDPLGLVDARTSAIRALPLDEFLKLEVKPRAQLLSPILPEKGLAMLYAPRGTGKTFLGLAVAYAVASGGTLMRWKAPAARKVLYVDGEMPTATLQERLSNIVNGVTEQPAPDNFMILPADYLEEGLPNLVTPAGQKLVERMIEDVALIVIDNISTLASAGHDNDVESWASMQGWLLKLRRRGHSVLLIHHAGKSGQQRGTSRREDVLDTVIALRRPADYLLTEGARFNVHIEKARGAYGDDVKAFEAKLAIINGAAQWTCRDLVDADLDRVVALAERGISVRNIAGETGLSRSTVHRLKKKAEESGRAFPGNDRDRG